jgi:hypothetical protein
MPVCCRVFASDDGVATISHRACAQAPGVTIPRHVKAIGDTGGARGTPVVDLGLQRSRRDLSSPRQGQRTLRRPQATDWPYDMQALDFTLQDLLTFYSTTRCPYRAAPCRLPPAPRHSEFRSVHRCSSFPRPLCRHRARRGVAIEAPGVFNTPTVPPVVRHAGDSLYQLHSAPCSGL